jgi:2-haloacid dehalogenase
MSRRNFLLGCSGAALGACAPPGPAPSVAPEAGGRQRIAAICFDLFTLFDPRSVVQVAREVVGDGADAFCEAWRNKQFQYAFLRAAGARYEDFRKVTEAALLFAARSIGRELSGEQRARLVGAYAALAPWPDTRATLEGFRRARLKLAPLANYSPDMLAPLLEQAGLTGLFDAQISTDGAKTFKPDPRAYELGPRVLGLPRERIAFAAFGGWDAAGAAWFGFPTFWVNRLGVTAEELTPGPHATGPTLAELAAFVESWA